MEFLSRLFAFFAKLFPMLRELFGGKSRTTVDVTHEVREEAEEAEQKAEDEMRDEGTGDYIRKHDI